MIFTHPVRTLTELVNSTEHKDRDYHRLQDSLLLHTLLRQAEEFVNLVMEVAILHDALKLCWDKILELVSLVKKEMVVTHNTYKFFQHSHKSL